jgi:AraC-like DNA-binding protein
MADPLAEIVSLLKPTATYSKLVTTSGPWRIKRSESGKPFFCVLLEGGARLATVGHVDVILQPGDFVMIPDAYEFTMTSPEPPPSADADAVPVEIVDGEFRLGNKSQPAEAAFLVGYCDFGSPDAEMLVPLLPQLLHVQGDERLGILLKLVAGEWKSHRPAREVVLARLLEVLLIEALRSTGRSVSAPGLLRGLADPRVAVALQRMHANPARPWTVGELAREAALSRSTFFERFRTRVGVNPMEYLSAWRMAIAKDLLRGKESVNNVAERVGYSSVSTFSVAFRRHVGQSPSQYAGKTS